ncbi:unnamed protein product [Paramecium sonneborni]|uniref:C2 domain-containing protein n=1 Tax=Paramecium sonneborni TaxID=65129 RepID=A0A8S1KMF6_9CILI|nr:unnamed protein product [Paramecium sonneborni]
MYQNTLQNSIKKRDKLTTSDTKYSRQSQDSYYIKNKQQTQLAIPSFRTLITSRCKTQQTIEIQYDKSPITTQRRILKNKDELAEKLIPRSDEILEIYDEFEKNYNHVKMLNQLTSELNYLDQQLYDSLNKQQQSNTTQVPTIQNNYLTQYDLNYQMKLDIQRFRFQYYRIRIKNQESPIQITFLSQNTQINSLRSYFSLKIEFPTKFNADYQVNSKSIRIFTNNTTPFFTEDYLFMTLYSQNDFLCTVVVTFGFERKQKINKQQKAESLFEDYIPRTKKHKTQPKYYQPEARLQNLLDPETLQQIKSQRQTRQLKVLNNGKNIIEEKQLDKKSKLFVKDQIIKYREIEKMTKQKYQYRNALQKLWLKCIFTTIFIHNINYILMCQKKQIRLEARGKLLVWQLQTKSLISVKDFGETPIERTIFKSSLSLNVICMILKKSICQKAKKVITSYLQSIILNISVLNKYQRWIAKIISIQRNFRNMKSKKRNFKEKLWRLIKEEFDDIIFEFAQLKGITSYYDYEERSHIHIDTVLMFSLLDEYAQRKKEIWQKYIHDTFVVNNPKNRLISLAINFKKPSLFQLPNDFEIREIIEKYAAIKKLI